MEWVVSTLHTTLERGVSSITDADAHTSAASSRLNWRPRLFKWTPPFRRKTKSGFCSCAITFQTHYTICCRDKAVAVQGYNLQSSTLHRVAYCTGGMQSCADGRSTQRVEQTYMTELFNEADSSLLSSALNDKIGGRITKSNLKLIECERRQTVVYKVMNLVVAKDWDFSQRCSWIQVFLDVTPCPLVNNYQPFGGTHFLHP